MLITNVTGNYFLKQNDTATEMHLAVIEVDGTPVDLTTASRVEVVIGTIEGRMLTKTPTLLSAPGELTFGLDEGDLLPPGDSLLEIHIITEQNERRVAPSKGHYKLRVQAPIGALGLTVTTYTLEYFLGEVNRILFGLPQLMERGNALADRMDELIDDSEQTLDVMNTTIEESRTATTESIGATIASELATQAAQQATTEAEQATVNAIQATVDAENATTDSLAQTQLAITATQAANDATLRATTQADRAEDAADDAISATADAIQATQNANDATGRANTAASLADTATSNANTATDAANTATTEANEARDDANIAASLADGIATDLLGYNSPISNFSLATRYIKHQHVRSNGSTYRAKVETQGNPLPVEPATSNAWFDLVSKKGDKGDAGTSLKPLGVKNDVSELPLTDNEPGDAYLVGQNMYMWDDGQWNDVGPIVGPQGEQGIQGDIGTGIEYVWDGTRLGVKREDEASFTYRELKGAKGDKGDNAKIISLDFVIPATDALQFNGNLITIRDYMYDPAADSLQVYQNSRILYPGEDFELENGNIRLASTIADPASTTFYVQVTRSVFDIDEEQSHATVVGALGYTPARSEDITQVVYDLEEADTRITAQLAQTNQKLEVNNRALGYYWIPETQPPARTDIAGSFVDAFNLTSDQYIANYFEPLRLTNSDYISRKSWGKDQSGTYDVWEYTFTPVDYKKTIILSTCLHGGEVTLMAAMLRFLHYLINEWEKYPLLAEIRENIRIVYVPFANPWGVSQKPRKRQNVNGVDLNRNFDYKHNEYPLGKPFDHDYKGTAPFSEKETQILRDLIASYPDAFTYLDFHNTGITDRDYFVYLPEFFNYKIYDKLVAYFTKDMPSAIVNLDKRPYPTLSNHVFEKYGIPASHPEWCDVRFGNRQYDSTEITKALEWIANVIFEHCRDFNPVAKLKNINITNIAVNSDFSNSTNGWTKYGMGALSVVDGALTALGVSGNSTPSIVGSLSETGVKAGTKIYAKIRVNPPPGCSKVELKLRDFTSNINEVITYIDNPVVDSFIELSGNYQFSKLSEAPSIQVQFIMPHSNDVIGKRFSLKELLVIDLSRDFSGYTPNYEEYNFIFRQLGNWFVGSQEILFMQNSSNLEKNQKDITMHLVNRLIDIEARL